MHRRQQGPNRPDGGGHPEEEGLPAGAVQADKSLGRCSYAYAAT
jgi:hypothetical protein